MLNIKGQLKKENIFTRKSLGQHFLIDENILEQIVEIAEVGPGDVVLEIGAGVGNLTAYLSRKASKVVAIEVDSRLVQIFKKNVSKDADVELFVEDALRFDYRKNLSDLTNRIKVVANLPYLISTPLLFLLIENRDLFSSFTLMLQKEVADRLAAVPGTKTYGALTVNASLFADVSAKLDIPPNMFYPRPKVSSRVVKIDILSSPRVSIDNHGVFKQVVNAAFNQRRKMLSNSLKAFGSQAGINTTELLKSLDIDPNRRGETLDVEEFALVANAVAAKLFVDRS